MMTHTCPACGGGHLIQTLRGFAGRSDSPHQFVTCQDCGQVVYEMLSVSQREIRLHRYEPNGLLVREEMSYRIKRILKVGFDEFLLYLHPLPIERASTADEPAEPAVEPKG